jgi:hypothetical protein
MTPRLPYDQQKRVRHARGAKPACRPEYEGKPGPEDIARANAYLSRLGVPASVLQPSQE